MKRIETIKIKPWERHMYPSYFSKTELKAMKLMPAPNVKPRAVVQRLDVYGGNYDLYTIEKTVPFRKTEAQKKREAAVRKLRTEKKKRQAFREKKLKDVRELLGNKTGVPDAVYETVVIDFETTGFDPNKDEILQVSIIDQDGNELMNQLCCPIVLQEWHTSEAIHGISPSMVKKKPSFLDIAPSVAQILLSANQVIAYNDTFESGFLSANGIDSKKIAWGDDPMIVYAKRHNRGRYAKLSVAAAAYGYEFHAHDALEDVRATLFLYKQLNSEQMSDKEALDYDCEDMAY